MQKTLDTVAITIDRLEQSPDFLLALLNAIPGKRYKERRVEGKWCIHEQICHLVDAQEIILGRFCQFRDEAEVHIRAHAPSAAGDGDHYMNMDMDACLEKFQYIRREMIRMLRDQSPEYWTKTGTHDAFEPYSSFLLLLHTLNVDHAHFFSIEQLGLTLDGLEREILVVP